MMTFEDVGASGGIRVVTLGGEIDAFTAPSLRLEFERLIKESSAVSTFVIDLEGVTFLDSSALGALVGALRLLRVQGATLRVVEPHGAAKRIFAQTGLDAVFALYPTRELALSRGETG
ncbi:STAS domain-containing protein [Gaiella sp.]|uniref:STAS domain-containing protein n=1 Tax=Gaiella sp. TaxID=2663207 RepID=UPI003263098B